MNSDITFQLHKLHEGCYQILFKGAGFDVASSPQDILENLRELMVNFTFLKERKLKKFFLCEEPLFNIAYSGLDIELYVYEFINGASQKKSMHCEQKFMLSCINEATIKLIEDSSLCSSEINRMEARIKEEMVEGVYDNFV